VIPFAAGTTNQLMDRMLAQIDHSLDSKAIFVYPLCIDGESDNPSGFVNFSKVSHAKFSFDMTGFSGNTQSADVEFYIGLYGYGVSYNWLQIRDGRALVSFALILSQCQHSACPSGMRSLYSRRRVVHF
jgi:hypothetical protein